MNKKKCVNIAVLTVSDTRTEEDDRSGQLLADRITDAGHHLAEKKIIKDEKELIQEQLKKWIDSHEVDVVIATGGTGVTGRDITPEAFEELYDKAIPGFGFGGSRVGIPKPFPGDPRNPMGQMVGQVRVGRR